MKRTLKESVGSTISQGYLAQPAKIGALARAGRLGIILWHWKYAGQDRGAEAANLLTTRAAKRFKFRGYQKEYELLRKLCHQVLREWHSPECSSCQGVREVSGEHKRIVCQSCEGTGIKRYGDYERADAMGLTLQAYRENWDKRLSVIYSLCCVKDTETYLVVREQLHEDEALIEATG